ncbi:MAG: GYF domain-containing protein [Flavobacteriales bacterium]
MNYLIDQNNQFPETYSKEDVQSFIDEGKIGPNTLIWTEKWGEWRSVYESDFNLGNDTNAIPGAQRRRRSGSSSDGVAHILVGLGFLALGGLITWGSYAAASNGGHYVVTTGLFVYGAISLLRGLFKSISS